MSETLESLRRKIAGAKDLESVVRTMKVLAASCIGQYERANRSLSDYYRTVELGLVAYFHETKKGPIPEKRVLADGQSISAVVFGSDQGLVGQFNDVLVDFVIKFFAVKPGKINVWAVGERIHGRLADDGIPPAGLFVVPESVASITSLVTRILLESEIRQGMSESAHVYIFHNRPKNGGLYEPVHQRLLPLDNAWRERLSNLLWPSSNLPQVVERNDPTLMVLIREYLFVSLFRACTESLTSENAARLAAMQRAEKNIEELLEELHRSFHRLRQSSIDEELFDVISGFEAHRQRRENFLDGR